MILKFVWLNLVWFDWWFAKMWTKFGTFHRLEIFKFLFFFFFGIWIQISNLIKSIQIYCFQHPLVGPLKIRIHTHTTNSDSFWKNSTQIHGAFVVGVFFPFRFQQPIFPPHIWILFRGGEGVSLHIPFHFYSFKLKSQRLVFSIHFSFFFS